MVMEKDSSWLMAVQRDIPLTRRPFAVLADRHGMREREVIDAVAALFDAGKARRFGGVFDGARLGYRSALCAAAVDARRLDTVAATLVRYPGITHCYRRGWPDELAADHPEAPPPEMPTLWFTIAALTERFEGVIESLRADVAPASLQVLPAKRRFKIDVVFAQRPRGGGSSVEASPPEGGVLQGRGTVSPPPVAEADRALVRAMQGNLPVVPAPYDAVATELGRDPDTLLDDLRRWKASGILRRVGVILHHRRVGFLANGMCLWKVSPAAVAAAGKTLASFAHVTHCYERDAGNAIPYNLFAMTHAERYEWALQQFQTLTEAAGLSAGTVLFSLREFKKTSPRYFCEDR